MRPPRNSASGRPANNRIPHPRMATYQIDSQHTGAHFKVRHMMISNVKGEFSHITGSVEFDPSSLSTARVEATIESASVNTREPQRDSHLKSRDFLDVG